ncbi:MULTISPECIES: Gfo/Idh/MocA family oxidoreductase [unclassified Streptomyces]|uniref:Gfo/Idh/MocA family protein n=1 Tax=unclassified Streptomyces TaxID=2593676 RepID=UPI002E297C93|nr:Gfo/Idh/MocA family oxidoreductase [Streptomyces sp. NBC_01423]WSX89080.1 Gfo/Idh/MocA family oxidoreductase [Streptomyces sp. NBC_00891]WSY03559.1 Gfo/Idh/MocA family oxidoreductase [Streptomyces sp. NBC_00890]WSZ05186.1 Gfo/Idh/MocA family oxidoreductase [Streptomyces sp. NBC_00869]WSZ27319.1 Gfo/Idh/MocA family oxidoreductase [Streptomyces sp. NBC_00870]
MTVTLAIVGAGARGASYARIAASQGAAVVTAVADPDPVRRQALADEFALPYDRVFTDWAELASRPRLADAAIVATPDRMHVEPAVALADLGYALLLEKPMAPSEEDARRIVDAATRNDILLAVCHVLRYTPYSVKLKQLIDSGRIGDVVSVEHLEPVGWWHQAHSYVRGKWGVEAESSSMLLAKSCHDIDWLGHVVGKPVEKVSSFGGLFHFRPENRPEGAGDRCVTCPVERTCVYSAPRIYQRFLGDPVFEQWPLGVLTDDVTSAGLAKALEDGPYGECVYNGRNDVVDHQVVNLQYEGGATASFTMTAFTGLDFRKTRVFGTHGSLDGDGRTLTLHDFLTDTREVFDFDPDGGASAADGHGGADDELIRAFLAAVAGDDRELVNTGPDEALRSHLVVWAAERARRSGQVVSLD